MAVSFVRLIAGAITHDIHSVWDDFVELLLRGEVKFTRLDRVRSLFVIPWFRRIWVIQEVTLNPNVYARHCNITAAREVVEMCAINLTSYVLNWASIKEAIRGNTAPLAMERKDLPPRTSHYWSRRKYSSASIYELFTNVHFFEATVPRDKLYAIYHLGADLPNLEFLPDYGQSLQATYASFTRQVIKATGSLQILSFACRQPVPKTWTWVPEYHQICSLSSWAHSESLDLNSENLWSQAHLYKSIYAPAGEPIVLRGVHFSTVSCIVQLQKPFSFPAIWKSLLQAHEGTCWKPTRTHTDADSESTPLLVTDFLAILLKDTCRWLCDDKAYEAILLSTYAADWIVQEPDLHSLITSPTNRSILRRLAENAQHEMVKTLAREHLTVDTESVGRFFLTQNGRVGLCPSWAQVDDLVVFLDGGPVPFLLRPINKPASSESRTVGAKRGQEFQLLGTCYLAGAMPGDVSKSPRWSNIDPL